MPDLKRKNLKTVLYLNILLFVGELVGNVWMFAGWGQNQALSNSGVHALKYFTVDSNILMGIISLYLIIELIIRIKNKQDYISKSSYILFLIGTVGVTLTFLVTVFFLTPTMAPLYGWLGLFKKSSFFLHLFNPVLSIVLFVYFLKTNKIKFIHTLLGVIPMFIYAIYYGIVSFMHVENGKIMEGYDWYGFLKGGIYTVFIVVPIMVILTYGISFILWKVNYEKNL